MDVAVKRIYGNSSPTRILNEVQHLRTLGGRPGGHVSAIIGGYCANGHTSLVLPFFEHMTFSKLLPILSLAEARRYIQALLERYVSR